jgi:hypothetical protein
MVPLTVGCFNTLFTGTLWREESQTFIEAVKHVIIRIGGGHQAHYETDSLQARGVHTIVHELEIDETAKANWHKKPDSIDFTTAL